MRKCYNIASYGAKNHSKMANRHGGGTGSNRLEKSARNRTLIRNI